MFNSSRKLGTYSNNTIYLKGGDNAILKIFVHEFTHYLEQTAEYAEYSKAVLKSPMVSKYVKQKGFGSINEYVNRVIELERTENGRTVSREHAECELVAHFTTDVLFNRTADKNVYDEFYYSLNKEHPEQARGFFAAIKNFLRKIRDLVTGHRYDSQFADLERRFSKMAAEVEQKYDSGSKVSADILADAQQKTAAEDTAGGEKSYIDITANMSEENRYNALKDKKIQPQKIEIDSNFDIDFEYLENNIKSIIEKPLIKKLRNLGYLRNYTTSVIDIDFDLTTKGLRKSLHSQTSDYGGDYADFAKVILNLQKLLDNSVLLEIHTDKGTGTSRENSRLKQVYVLLSAFQEGNFIKPVQFEIKEYVDDNNRLYLAVALTKIETGVVGNTALQEEARTYLLPISNISLADLFSKINPKDKNFLKYVPDQFLNNEQIEAKNKALQIDREKYSIVSDKANFEEKSFLSLDDYHDNEPITIKDIETLRSIGRKSINEFTQENIRKSQKWAYKFYQQLGEKSPFFRAWFGDWRAYDVSAANVVKFAYGETPKLNYKKREVYCEELKTKIVVDETVINDSKSYAKKNGEEKQITKLLGKIDKILSNGILLDTRISERSSGNKKGSTQFMHYLYTPISVNGAPFIAKLSVEEYDLSGKTRAYNLQRIELSEVYRAQYSQLIEENREKYAYTSDALSVAQLFDFVKQKDKNFNPKHVDKHLVNEDGTPKNFYHGTNGKFTSFNPKEIAPREGSFFFAENREDAAAYGNNIFEVYLTGNKFADYDNQPSEFYRLRDKRKQVEYLKERGYDGWYADMDSEGWGEVSVFSPTQIKSATDNTGTFDESNPDIRYFLSLDDYVDDASYERVLKRKNDSIRNEAESQIVAIHQLFREGNITESEMVAAEKDVMKNLFKKIDKQTHDYVKMRRDRDNQRAEAKRTRSEVKGEIRNEMTETERKRVLRDSIRRRVKSFANKLNANTNTRNIPDNLKGLAKASIGLISEGRFSTERFNNLFTEYSNCLKINLFYH